MTALEAEAVQVGASNARQNALSFDVEDYFQVHALSGKIAREDWESQPQRLQKTMDRLFELLSGSETHATFFVLGWVAQSYPEMVRSIVRSGHELASHGFEHIRVSAQTPEAFRNDITRTKKCYFVKF